MSRRLRTVQTWGKHCGNPGALDVSSRWYSCVAAHVIVGDRPLRGVAEMLSTHFLLIDDDGEVIFDAEISEVISVQRRQEVAVGETMSLGGDTPPIIRTCIELVVRSRGVGGFAPRRKRSVRGGREGQGHSPAHQGEDNAYLTEESGDDERDADYSYDNAHNNNNTNSSKGLSSKGGEHGGRYLSHEGTNRLISEADAEVGDSAFDRDVSHSKSPRRDNSSADDGGSARGSGAVPITFILEGPEGAHFAAGMELLWRRKFRMLSLRDQAMCRCSHISDFIFTISMLPLDVDCVLLQEQFPPNWRPNLGAVGGGGGDALASSAYFGGSQNGVGSSASSPYGGGGGAGAAGTSSPYSSSTGVTITRDKSAVLRIDQNYVLRIIPRPDSLYESLTAGGLAAGGARALASSINNTTSFLNKTASSFIGSGQTSPLLASKSTFSGTSPAAAPTTQQTQQYQQWVFHLSDVLLITHSDNQLRIVVSDGRVLVLGSVDTRTVSGSSEQRSVTAGNDGVNSSGGIGGSSSGQSQGGGGGSSSGNASALSASNLALERRKAEAAATKAATGIDIAAMTAGSRNILDIFLFFSSTACYQQLYLAARGVTKPNVSFRTTSAAASGGNAFDSPDLETEATALLMPPVVPPEACFTSNDLYRVYHHYCSVDVNSDGTLSPVELFSAIGPVLVDNEGSLPQALLKTFDVCKKGSIQLAEYFYGSRVLLRGTVRDRLLYLFALFDTESKGTIVLSEFTAGMRLLTALTAHTRTANRLSASGTISRLIPFAGGIGVKGRGSIAPQVTPGAFVVAGPGGTPESLDAFAKELFVMIDTNKNGEIDVEEFCKAMTMNPTVINALKRISSVDETAAAAAASSDKGDGSEADPAAKNSTTSRLDGMPAVIYSAKLENASNPNTIVTFGHPRWREMVQIIAGIEHACRHPEALRVVDQKSSFSVKVPHDCSAWGNHALAGEVALRAMRNQQLQQQQLRAAAGGATAANFQQVLNNPPSAVLASSGSGGSNESITFNDYCPAVFHTIRRSFGLSNEEYLQSVGISQLRSGLLFGSISCLYEMISSGRSGSFFYSSHDNKFIMKTIPMSESVILRKMLPAYYEHVLKYPNTLLTRFCGLHALTRNGRKLIFVVMQNIFQNKVSVCETYDLKGSTVGRSTPMALRAPGVALKDNDFGARKIYMRSHIKRDLIKQIQVDSELLARHNLNDYSFLLGIHTSFDGPLDRRNSPPCDFPSHNKFQQFYGGIEGAALIDPATEAKGKESAAMNEVNALRVTADDDDWGVVETDHRSRAGIIPLALARHHSGSGGSSPSSPVVSNGNGVVLDDFKSVPIVPTDPQRPLRYEIYFVGIIDMLTDYGVKKRGEHYSKSILYDSKQVSCIAPQEYVSRYIQYLDSIMVAID